MVRTLPNRSLKPRPASSSYVSNGSNGACSHGATKVEYGLVGSETGGLEVRKQDGSQSGRRCTWSRAPPASISIPRTLVTVTNAAKKLKGKTGIHTKYRESNQALQKQWTEENSHVNTGRALFSVPKNASSVSRSVLQRVVAEAPHGNGTANTWAPGRSRTCFEATVRPAADTLSPEAPIGGTTAHR